MDKILRRQLWTCSKCLKQQRTIKRYSVAAVDTTTRTAGDRKQFPSVSSHSPEVSTDDQILRKIFDSQPFWHEFSQSRQWETSGHRKGLFQNRYLTSPAGFQEFANVTLAKCRSIVAKVLSASSVEDYRVIVKDLDRLSDLLCRVIDLSDFVRSTHPDRKIQAAATQAYALMFEYMNVLNTTTGLNEQLKCAVANVQVTTSWSEEERVVAQILVKDFSKSAIDLPLGERQKFIDLSNEISQLGPDFVDNMAPEKQYLVFESSKLKGIDPTIVRQLVSWGKVTMPTIGAPASIALRTVEDEETRKEIYMASRTASKGQLRKLESLLSRRAQIAKLSGYDSFAQMALGDKMANSPESVNDFLHALVSQNGQRVRSELAELSEMKKKDSMDGVSTNTLNAWDRDYYTSRLFSRSRSKLRAPDFLSAYFSLGTVMQGLSRLFSRLYGIRFVPREPLLGETWNEDVRRLDVIDQDDGHIAVVYCDLFERAGKSPNPAHFTLRCSRHISEDEIAEASRSSYQFKTPIDGVNDGMAVARNTDGGLYQLPTIALICDFARGPSKRPTLLTFREVQTLFHEMGHAVHSILGRTALQNVSGTRCATDFAELPSVLMEHFSTAPEVLGLFARHWETDTPLPYQMVMEKIDLDRRLSGAETESQILLALLDQSYHSSLPLSKSFDSTLTYHAIFGRHASLQEPPGTSWQGFFGHLFSYGATYYSYLFDRAIAGKVWRDVFQSREGGALNGDAGQLFKNEVLRWGGGRDGWKCIAGALKDETLAKGGPTAMAEVGRWGVTD